MAEDKHGYWDFEKYQEGDLSGEGYLPDDQGRYYHLARRARDNGWRNLIPISPGSKACYVTGWDRWGREEPTDAEIRDWIEGSRRKGLGEHIGFGFAHNGTLIVIDLDYEDENDVKRRLRYLSENVPGTPMIRIGKSPGCQIYYRAGPTAYGRQCGPEIFHLNKQTVLFGWHARAERSYRWKGGSPACRRLIDVPKIHGKDIDGFLMRFGHDRMPGRQGGMVMSILKDWKGLDPMTLNDMAARLSLATKSMRHPTCQALVSYAYFYMYSVEDITAVLQPVFLSLFERGERRGLVREFEGLIKYAVDENNRAIKGITVPGVPL
ncbi:bifunctional DNA primase/polymerase [Rhizobium sp. BK251]|uniref:bifunctional DNA primase/polymerase n=1 Tax=Rhizobium sp. BK251 TaxID=2512125 RepID=UPI0010E0701B|nr:bifunctional DNA primase/polymerase [Rhizobium sp. BK251]TCL65107.1 bifunctional DNA primase/polymerase-like protein [Rhizobium sp. BK251]